MGAFYATPNNQLTAFGALGHPRLAGRCRICHSSRSLLIATTSASSATTTAPHQCHWFLKRPGSPTSRAARKCASTVPREPCSTTPSAASISTTRPTTPRVRMIRSWPSSMVARPLRHSTSCRTIRHIRRPGRVRQYRLALHGCPHAQHRHPVHPRGQDLHLPSPQHRRCHPISAAEQSGKSAEQHRRRVQRLARRLSRRRGLPVAADTDDLRGVLNRLQGRRRHAPALLSRSRSSDSGPRPLSRTKWA